MSFDYSTLIYNRQSQDITTAKNITSKVKNNQTLTEIEQRLFDAGLKGCYNISDLNRVESCCRDLSDKLNECGYYNNIVTKTNWELGDIVSLEELNRVKNNLQTLKDTYAVLSTTPQVPSTSRTKINYVEANDMEKILSDIEKLIGYMQQNYIYGGVANGGQNRIWQQRFRRPRYWGGLQFDNISESTNDITLGNISVLNDEANFPIDKYSSVYGTVKALNNSYVYLDEMVGGLNG